MRIRIGINGFGRIGRLALRAALKNNDIDIVAINDILDIDYIIYMLKYDSTHGKFTEDINIDRDYLIIGRHRIRVTSERNIEKLQWNEVKADYIVESTGLFLTKELAELHLKSEQIKLSCQHLLKIILQYL